MENLKHQIQKEIESIPDCELQDIFNVREYSPSLNREGYLCICQYFIPCGSLKKKKITIGVELPQNDYPRLPPHFIHLKPAEFSKEEIEKMGKIHESYEYNGANWITLSRPPEDIWDGLESFYKNLCTFFESHLRRFWDQL